ncbi:MAG: glycoside hydrolase family 5 protein [bacterium]|nr:glycoside hydrolase family 5 protein [bacterium]
MNGSLIAPGKTLRWLGLFPILAVLLGVGTTNHAADPATTAAQTTRRAAENVRYRGFNLEGNKYDAELMNAAAAWGANQVRTHLINRNDARRNRITLDDQLDRELTTLPRLLDNARAAGLAVVLTVPQTGTNQKPYMEGEDNKARLAAFWDDDTNRQMYIDIWRRIAAVCKGRDQVIWYDLVNEPLDWRDFPGYPKKWPEWAQAIADAIRTIDPATPIVIEPGPGGMCNGLTGFPVPRRGGPFIFSFHSYIPFDYTYQGLADVTNTDLAHAYLQRQIPWPRTFTQGDKIIIWNRAWLEEQMAPVIEFQKRYPDIRLHVGEFSTLCWTPNAAGYLRDSIEIFEKHGWDWDYHCFRGFPGWSLEAADDYAEPKDTKLSPTPTDRARVVREFLARNQRQTGS